ncbi:MAG: cation diffusion facilitator family transporter, partial [Kiritimatiellae bacterium]|nr:cation diffusion facilitator family transporter [Kiritimatiellia bacterium]
MTPPQTIPPNGQRITILALVFSLLLATLKIVCGFLGQSQALIADGMESIADVFSSLTVWGGLHVANRPPDQNHPFGHGKAESLAGLLVGFFMLGAALAIARNSLLDLPGPHTPPKAWTLLILIAVMLAKEGMFHWMRAAGKRLHSTALENEASHHRAAAIPSLAAFIGISVAIVGGPNLCGAANWGAGFGGMLIGGPGLRRLRRCH